MGEAAMELSSEQKDFFSSYISNFIRKNLKVWITESATNQAISEHELKIHERIVRVEESLDKQIALMKQGFDNMDKRFEQVDKRFELLTGQMDKRFNQMFAYFTTGIVTLGILITAFQVLG